MLLSHKTDIQLNTTESNIVGHMCYAASKLWNVCNYERRNFKELGMVHYPDWYDQKARLKGNMWFKSLPSQTAQEVCKLVDKSWKSFYALIKSKGIQNPKPPRFKQSGMTITYMQNAIVHVSGSKRVRLSLPKQLKEYLKHTYDIGDNYLYLENKIFQNTDVIKQIKIYPPDRKNVCQVIVIYDVKDVEKMQDNGHYLSIDLGLHSSGFRRLDRKKFQRKRMRFFWEEAIRSCVPGSFQKMSPCAIPSGRQLKMVCRPWQSAAGLCICMNP